MAGELDRLTRLAHRGGWKPTLVICPKALLYTWGEWFARCRPTERVMVIDPRSKATREPFLTSLRDHLHDIYVIHYEGLRLLLPQMHAVEWLHIILDEAHRISNRKTQTSKAVRALKADWRTALTGTPAERMVDQIWAILNFLDRKTWSSYWAFRKRYVLEKVDPVRGYRTVVGANPATLPELHARLKPIMVRRRKQDVLPELPPKRYKNVWVDLSPKQRKVYQQMKEKMLAWVGEHEDEPLQATVVIAQLIRLQQIALATPDFNEDGQIILSEPSSKLDACMEIIEDLVANGEQVVVFSQFTRMIDLLCDRLERAGIYTGKYTGQTRQTTRTRIEQEFQAGNLSVFAGQFQAGGVGLNLQTAGTVIFLDRAWTGGVNLQAEDRIHRMGQLATSVNVIDILARGTIDRGRHQHIRTSWHEVQKMLGDKRFDWTHSLDEEVEPAI